MILLTIEQESFLKYHKIDISKIFDATWLRHKEYREIMKNLEKLLAIWVTPCEKAWHTLRTRHWQCVQCDVSLINYSQRWNKLAYVYIAGSIKWWILKVWFAEDVENRKEYLNSNKYAWLNDWEVIYRWKYSNAWQVESFLHTELSKYWFKIKYNTYWREIICYETFKCNFLTVKDILNNFKNNRDDVSDEYCLPNAEAIYNFQDVESNEKRIWTSSKEAQGLREEIVLKVEKETIQKWEEKTISKVEEVKSQWLKETRSIVKEVEAKTSDEEIESMDKTNIVLIVIFWLLLFISLVYFILK